MEHLQDEESAGGLPVNARSTRSMNNSGCQGRAPSWSTFQRSLVAKTLSGGPAKHEISFA